MTVALTRTRSAAPLFCGAATQSSLDEVLMTRIAGGDQLAMRTLFCAISSAIVPMDRSDRRK